MSTTIISINLDTSQAMAMLARVRGAITATTIIHRVAAEAVAKEGRPWFIARNAARSRHTTSNYWAHAAEAIHTSADATAGTVTIRHPGIHWHRHGGTISAKPGKAMAIPLRAALYGVWPSEHFASRDDAFVWRKGNKAFLAARPGKGIPGTTARRGIPGTTARRGIHGTTARRGELRLLYLLLKSVSKDPDPSVLPPAATMQATATAAVKLYLQRSQKGQAS